MKKRVAIMMLAFGCSMAANAQTFLDRLQTSAKGQGKVSVHQTAAISELVNGTSSTTVAKPTTTSPRQDITSKIVADKEPTKASPDKSTKASTDKSTKASTDKSTKASTDKSTSNSTPTVTPIEETRLKVPSKSYKATGYRVQVFAGGNTRADRQKAESIGNALKSNFPGEPVYVHFYSPRWICRMGNYRSYELAHKMLQEVKGLGYKQATIVRGKITVML